MKSGAFHGGGRAALTSLVVLLTALGGLAGCSSPAAVRSGYLDHAGAYAQMGNQQLLLNLARIRNGHPTYFLQMGAITTTYSLSRGVNLSREGTAGAVTGLLGLSGSTSESPVFTYSPLSGPAFSSMVMRPVAGVVMHGLAAQGFPLRTLLRLVADELHLDAGGDLRPAAGRAQVLRNDSEVLPQYVDFLRLVSALQALQDARVLRFEVDEAREKLRIVADERAVPVLQAWRALNPVPVEGGGAVVPDAVPTGEFRVEVAPRTFLGLMYAMAQDGVRADALPAAVRQRLPADQVDAILRIEGDDLIEPEAVSLDYAGRRYRVADRAGQMRYRTTFQAMQILFAYIELDPDQLPKTPLIQTR